MFYLRDLPKYDAIRSRAARYPEVNPAAVEAFLVLLRTGSDVLAALERFLSAHNLSQGSWTVLMVLNRDPAIPLMPSDLASKCGVTRATMTGLLDGLERKRLVRREPDPTDRRTLRVRLTREGVDLLDGMTHDYYRRVALLMRDLNDDDKRSLSDMLHRVLAHVDDVAADPLPPVAAAPVPADVSTAEVSISEVPAGEVPTDAAASPLATVIVPDDAGVPR